MKGWAVDWEVYGKGKGGGALYYYDPQSIKRVSKDIIRVWHKTTYTETTYTEKSMQDVIKGFEFEPKEVSCSIALFEYDCSEKKVRTLSLTTYTKAGDAIDTISYDSPSWNFVIPDSVGEFLFNIVCGCQEKKDGEIP